MFFFSMNETSKINSNKTATIPMKCHELDVLNGIYLLLSFYTDPIFDKFYAQTIERKKRTTTSGKLGCLKTTDKLI